MDDVYTYNGEVYSTDGYHLGRWTGQTKARSPEEAKRNLLFRARRHFRQPVDLVDGIKCPAPKPKKIATQTVENNCVQLKINFAKGERQ